MFGLFVIVVQHRPGHPDYLVLHELGGNGFRFVGRRVVERRHIEFQHEFAAFARLEVVFAGRVCVGEIFDLGLAAPSHGPILSFGGGEDVVILRVDAMERIMGVQFISQIFNGVHLTDQRPT